MSNFTITIEAPELAAAITNLASALISQNAPIQIAPAVSAQPTAPAAPAAPVAPVAPQAPVAAAPVAPTAPDPVYDLQQLTLAASPLVDAGRQTELVALLAQFGVQSLTQLPKEHYGAFATALRGMGARI